MLISFEGIDGCGKSTQIKLLKHRLIEQNYDVSVFREPGGTDVSEQIRGILLNPEIDLDPVSELLLFSAARAQLIASMVKPRLEKGEIVILDRFFDSTTAYQGYGRSSMGIDEIHLLNKIASHHIEPDVTFYLKIDLNTSESRRASFSKDRMEQAGADFFAKVIEGYDSLAAQFDRIITINAVPAPAEVHEQIWDQVSNRL